MMDVNFDVSEYKNIKQSELDQIELNELYVSVKKHFGTENIEYVVTKTCYVCGKIGFVLVSRSGMELFERGAYVQMAFAEMEASLREQMISGTHPECWDALYNNMEDW